MNNIKNVTIEYSVACENGAAIGTRAGIAGQCGEAAFACENTSSEQVFVPGGNVDGLFYKTGNNLGAISGRMRRSGGVCNFADSGLVQTWYKSGSEFAGLRGVALGCVGSLFTACPEFGCSAGNSVLAAA